ncbi:MAG: Asp-tRNA(Asn)/Glu-tRNA(Gln) amidotransferase subunit GatA [Patescibacteria group bacterium]
MNVQELSIKDALVLLQNRKVSVVELTKAYLDRIEELQPKLNAFITVCGKEALERAKWADGMIAKDGKEAFKKYPLLGIPYAAKDLFCTKGIETTAGSSVLRGFIPEYDATVIKRLNEAGAILIGKTNCDAWGHGASGENSDFGPTRNPWDLERVSGGSSSGSAAAVAASLAAFATGTDTGGSIRNPASFCNLTGLKPTYGRVSRYGVVSFASSLDCMGHLAKTVEDCKLILSITEGKDPFDATSAVGKSIFSVETLHATSLRREHPLRVGLPREYFGEGVNKEVSDTVKAAAGKLEELGHKIEEVSLPMTEYGVATYYLLAPSETSSNLSRYDGIRYGNPRSEFGEEAKRRIMLGTYALSAGYYDAYYEKAQKVRTLMINDFVKVFSKVDVLLAPVAPCSAFKIGEVVSDPLRMYMMDVLTIPSSLAGLAALALPAGFSKEGLPVGMQLIGPQWSEELLFKVGKKYQEATDWHKKVVTTFKVVT